MWPGFVTFGGNEVINCERTAVYARNDGAHWFRDPLDSETLAAVIGDVPYRSPLQDEDTPWVDPDLPDTIGFYGFYPLDITGVDDSTRTSVITENVGDGGNAGRLRHGTRQMVFSGLLLGESDAAVDAGLAWLRSVLLTGTQGGCDDGSCDGADLCFFAAEPPYDPDREDCGDLYLRTIQQVTVTNGPIVTAKNNMSDGSAVWQVQFTATANIPWHFGPALDLVKKFPATAGEYATGTDVALSGYTYPEVKCPGKSYTPVFDPNSPDLVLPPPPPAVRLGNYKAPSSWRRYTFRIPAVDVRLWTDIVPLIKVHTGTVPLRDMRIRIYPDVTGRTDPDDHPCGYCADFVISYCPENVTMQIDGTNESVLVLAAGQSRRADGLVFDTKGQPFSWPSMSCGIGYVVTVDQLLTQSTGLNRRPLIDFSLVPRLK